MKRFSFSSLRVRLILLVLLAIIPALGITLYSGLEHRKYLRQDALDDALRLAQDISETHDRLIQDARQILFALSKTSEVQQQDKAACSKIFADMMKQSQGYTALVAAKPNGDQFASSVPITHPVNYSDRPWFQRLLKTRDFAIGEYSIGRVSGKPLIALAYPVLDDIGNLKAALFFGMDLEWLNQTVVKSKLQEGTSVTVIDSDGTILFRYPEPEKFIGKSMPEVPIVKAILAKREGVEESIDLGGVPRLFGFTSLGKGVESVHVSMGIPKQIALAKADRVMKDNLAYLGLIALLALAAAWFIGGFFIVHPVNRLLDTTKQLANGDLTVRTGPPYRQGEIGQLAWAFDHMATSLEQREGERRRAENEVISAKARLEYLLSSAPSVIYASETRGDYPPTFISATIKMQLGYDPEEFLSDPKFWSDRIHPEDAPRIFAELPRLFEQGLYAHEYRFLHKNGTYRWIHDEMSLMKDEEGNPSEIVGSMIDITERKQAEEELQTSERRYRMLMDSANDAIFIADTETGMIVNANLKALAMIGRSLEEIQKMHQSELYPPEEKDRYKAIFRDLALKTSRITGDLNIVNRDGQRIPVEISDSVIEIEGKHFIQGIFRDITERKQMEEDLRKSKMQFQELFDNAPVGYHEADKEGRFTRVNQTELEMLGYSAEEMVGQPIWNFIKSEENIRQIFFGKIFGKIPPGHSYERCYLRKDGTTLAVLAEDKLLRDKDGKITGLRSTIQDITERKRAEEEVQRNYDTQTAINSILRLSLENISHEEILKRSLDLILSIPWLVFESRGCIFLVEDTPEVLVMKAQNGLGKPIQMSCAQVPFGKCLCGRTASTGEIYFADHIDDAHEIYYEGIIRHGHYCVPIMSGGVIFGVLNIYVKEGHNRNKREEEFLTAVANTLAGIIVRNRGEKEMAALQEEFRQSQKVEAIGQLAGGIAHDFNNLLTIIKGYGQFSLLELPGDDPLRENIEEIQKAADRASALTRQLLAFSRRQIMEMRVLNLNDLIRNLEKMLHRVIGEDIELVTFLAEDLGRVKADPGQIEQVIMNVSVNARDAMPTGGKLTIETANVELDEAYSLNHVAVKPGRYVMFSVSDTGAGMTSEVRERVFEPFFTTKERGKGTGLGLSTVYGIVKQSGGNIWVYSEPGRGTTFKIYLPRVDEPLEEVGEKVVQKEIAGRGETILVVEDEEKVRQLTVQILTKNGYTVLDASQGDEASHICKQHKGPIHLMVMDVVMPGMNGRELAKSLASHHPEMKVLYMSGYTDNTIVHHGILEKGLNFIQKPFSVEGLATKVREVLDK